MSIDTEHVRLYIKKSMFTDSHLKIYDIKIRNKDFRACILHIAVICH